MRGGCLEYIEDAELINTICISFAAGSKDTRQGDEEEWNQYTGTG